jgi:outer membrane protein TolC
MRYSFVIFIYLGFFWSNIFAQNKLSLQECYRMAEANTAIVQNPALLENLADLRLQNIAAARLPTVQWNARATWQNEVFGLPFSAPGVEIDIPHYNILTNLEANYLLYDGGLSDARKTLEKAKLAVDRQAVAVELYKLKEQVNQYFFAALLLQEQAHILAVTQQDLEAKSQQLEAGVRHGAVLESDLKKVQVEQLRIAAKIAEVQSDRRAMLAVLGSLAGQALEENVQLELPGPPGAVRSPQLQRPEMALFALQKQQLMASSDLIDANWSPKASAFATTGLGYPDPLNIFDDKISPYFIGGLQFSWKILDWKQADRERQQLAVQVQIIDNQQKTFEKTIGNLEGKFQEDILKINKQITADEEIAKLQGEILQQLSSQLEHGTITPTDYLLQSNAELQARLTAQSRRVQLAQVEAAWRTWNGEN